MLATPLNLRIVKKNNGTFLLKWKAVHGAQFYEVYVRGKFRNDERIQFVGSSLKARFEIPCYLLETPVTCQYFVIPVSDDEEGRAGVIMAEWQLVTVFFYSKIKRESYTHQKVKIT